MSDVRPEELLAALRRGENEAFRQVAERELGGLYRLAWGILGSDEAAEDACQETLVRLHLAARKLPPGTSLRAWLRRVCVNYCLDMRRRARREPAARLPEAGGAAPSLGISPEQAAEEADLRAAVWRALAQLSPGQRAAFVLRHCHGCSVSETSKILGCAEGTVKAQLSRAVRRLRELLGEWRPQEAKVNRNE